MFGNTIVGGATVVTESEQDDTLLWHMWKSGIRELQNPLVGVNSCKLDVCKNCVMEKQCSVQFKIATHKAKGILDYMYSDSWGPRKVL